MAARHSDALAPTPRAIRSARQVGLVFVVLGLLPPLTGLIDNPVLSELPAPLLHASLMQLLPAFAYVSLAPALKGFRRVTASVVLLVMLLHGLVVAGIVGGFVWRAAAGARALPNLITLSLFATGLASLVQASVQVASLIARPAQPGPVPCQWE